MTGVLTSRGKFGQRHKGHVKTEAEIGKPGATRSWKRQGRTLSERFHREHGPANTLISDF